MHSLLLDFSVAFRFFARRRAATAVIVLTMALALGANTAVFSVLQAFLLSSLGVPESDRVMIVPTTKDLPGRGTVNFFDAYPNYKLLSQTTRSFSDHASTFSVDVNWELPEDTRRLQGQRVTASFFNTMRVQPVIGRAFEPREEGPNAAPVAILSHALWHSAFAGDPGIIGRVLRLNGAPHTVVGVMPPRFSLPAGAEIWLPYDLPAAMWTAIVGGRGTQTYTRLAPGVSVADANRELLEFAPRAREADANNKDWGWRVSPLRENILFGADKVVIFVQAGAAVLLALALSNLASLLLAWAAERQRESALRLALGATGWRLARQFLVQSLVLVAAGGVLGVFLAWLTIPALKQLNPNQNLFFFLQHLEMDSGILGFAAALVLGTGLLAGLLPAWQARSVALQDALRTESRAASLGRGALRSQQAMVVLQAAVAVLILTGAALAGLGFHRLTKVRTGFATENRVVLRFQFPEPAYAAHEKRAQFVQQLEANLAREPALTAFGVTSSLPVGDLQWGASFRPRLASGEYTPEPVVFHYRRVSPGYLAALGVPLIAGRHLDPHDAAGKPAVAVVSRALAGRYWPGEDAIGRKLKRSATAAGLAPEVEIVGIVGDVFDAGAGAPAGETVYVPFAQHSLRLGSILLAGAGSIEDTIAVGRRALRTTEPAIAAYNIATMESLAWQANSLPRLQMVLLGVFAVIATGITALGSYGVMSQLVANREREMAIRAALGASRGEVLRLVLWSNARLAAGGALLGLGGAGLVARWARGALTGFPADTLWPYAAVTGLVLLLTQLASYVPARRAARLDVQKALTAA